MTWTLAILLAVCVILPTTLSGVIAALMYRALKDERENGKDLVRIVLHRENTMVGLLGKFGELVSIPVGDRPITVDNQMQHETARDLAKHGKYVTPINPDRDDYGAEKKADTNDGTGADLEYDADYEVELPIEV